MTYHRVQLVSIKLRIVGNAHHQGATFIATAENGHHFIRALDFKPRALGGGKETACSLRAPGHQPAHSRGCWLGIGRHAGTIKDLSFNAHPVTGLHIDVVKTRQRPAKNVVEFGAQTQGTAALLLGEKILGHRAFLIQKGSHHTACRLTRGNQVGTLGHITITGTSRFGCATNLNAMTNQVRGELVHRRGITCKRYQILSGTTVLTSIGTAAIFNEVTQERFAVSRSSLDGANRSYKVTLHTIGIGDGFTVATLAGETSCGSHFEGHADTAMECRPGVSVTWVVGVINRLREILEAEQIKPFRVITAVSIKHLFLCIDIMRVERLRRWRKEVARISSHLMDIHVDEGEEFLEGRDSANDLRLGEWQPIPVQIEQVVIGTTSWPGLSALGSDSRGAWRDAISLAEMIKEAFTAIRVLTRVDSHERVLANRIERRSPGCQHVVSSLQASVGTGDLIAVNAVGEPYHGR